MARSAQVNPIFIAAFLAASPLSPYPRALGAALPEDSARLEALAILESVRFSQSAQRAEYRGRLRNGPTAIPFRLLLEGERIRYLFEGGVEPLELRLDEDRALLEKEKTGEAIMGKRLLEKVGGTDLSYEDISLRFLYWRDARIAGDELVLTRPCVKLELHPPKGSGSQYGTVWAWVEKKTGALLRAEGYRPDGQALTRFSVVSGQKIDGLWVLKRMRIERMEEGRPRDKTPTYLEIDGK